MDIYFDDSLLSHYQCSSFLDQWIVGCTRPFCYEYFIFILTASRWVISGAAKQNVYDMDLHVTSHPYMVLYYIIVLFFDSSPSDNFIFRKIIQYFLYSPFSEFVTMEIDPCLSQYSFLFASAFISCHLLHVDLPCTFHSFVAVSLQ